LLLVAAGAAFGASAPTYSEDVAPILLDNCASCHRPGQAGPFSLLTYEDAKKRGQLIVAVTESRYMPPWHADESDVPFHGSRRMRDAEIATLAQWVKGGMPEGDPAKAPAPPQFAEGWELGEPDAVATMRETYEIPADGPDLYRYFVLDLPVGKTEYMSAIEFQPGSRPVVHHVLGFLVDGKDVDGAKPEDLGRFTNDGNRVLTWAVGTNPRILPEDIGVEIRPGMKMVAQMHYHPTGKVERDRSRVGFYFAAEKPAKRYIEVQAPADFGQLSAIDVPAGSDTYTLRETFTLPVDVDAFSTFAHAHYIGKAFELEAQLPSGETKKLLKIGNYDFAWQEIYNFQDPVRLPAGTKLKSTIRWDNRAANPVNPYSPPRNIQWGLFSEDEMGSIILDVVVVNPADEAKLLEAKDERDLLSMVSFYVATDGKFCDERCSPPKNLQKKAEKFAKERFDKNGDGKLDAAEKAVAREFLSERGFDDPTKRDVGGLTASVAGR
ncbi:MAG: hypothetical protein KDC27_13350, partial [Acidobacteria bacterium]|nr:hypothetical protein [Acidobacteriota bacterium]